jgi:aspartate/glutamate racemase
MHDRTNGREVFRSRGDQLCRRDELGVVGRVLRDESREAYRRIIDGLRAEGVGGVILGCTEITLLISQEDVSVPVFDTAALHAQAAVTSALL